jgi:hypothetical protein
LNSQAIISGLFGFTTAIEIKQGLMNRWIDRFFIAPVIRRGIRRALENLQNHFADQRSGHD